MSKWRVILTPEFKQEVREIHSYIANTLLNPQAAKGQINRILDGAEALSAMPLSHPLCNQEPWRERGLRKMVINNFVLFFYPNQETQDVVVYHIFYGGRDIQSILEI